MRELLILDSGVIIMTMKLESGSADGSEEDSKTDSRRNSIDATNNNGGDPLAASVDHTIAGSAVLSSEEEGDGGGLHEASDKMAARLSLGKDADLGRRRGSMTGKLVDGRVVLEDEADGNKSDAASSHAPVVKQVLKPGVL